MGYRVAVVGATGNVGREMLNILDERKFPADEVAALASSRSAGSEVDFGNASLTVGDVAGFEFDGWDMALFAIGSAATEEYAPLAADAGCTVIDNSSLYRYDPDVPLIVPEVNPDAVEESRNRNIIANPNCSTAQMVVALKPLHDRARVKRVVVSTYQSVSGSGKAAMDELWEQTKMLYAPGQEHEPTVYPTRIAFNVLPHIDNPNCSTAQMVVALKPLHDRARVKRVVVSTYQSVSGSGKAAMDELWEQTKMLYAPGQEHEPTVYPTRIAFNVLPHIDKFLEDGSTKEEWKMSAETKRIVDPSIEVTATCVRVPVFIGHSEAVNVEFEEFLDEGEAREILQAAPGVVVVDRREDCGYMTPRDCVGEYATYVSRIRQDGTVTNGLNFWCVSDNLRKGAALNAVQIAELYGRRILRKG